MSRDLNRSRVRRRHPADNFAPAELTDPFDRAIFFLGALTQVWTILEGLIDRWVDDIHRNGGTRIQETLPASLDRALDYLTAALRIGLVSPDRAAEAERLISELHSTKNFRHDFVHGLGDFSAPKFAVELSKVRGGSRITMRSTYSPDQRRRHYKRTLQLAHDLAAFVYPVSKEEFLEQQRQLSMR